MPDNPDETAPVAVFEKRSDPPPRMAAPEVPPARDLLSKRNRVAGIVLACLIALAFLRPLTSLFLYVAGTKLHSHVLLIPFISAYLLYIERRRLPRDRSSSPILAMIAFSLSLLAFLAGNWARHAAPSLSENDYFSFISFAFVCFVAATGFALLGRRWMAAAAFPIAFLLFMIPLPDALADFLETSSKLASAEVANLLFGLCGTPIIRDGVVFQLPGIVIQVAQECSGIHSSLVLFITSSLAAHLFLRSPWRKALLLGFVIPLGVLRNGFRILVIGLLCVHVSPAMIHSAIHKKGGPFFFVLSLVPLFLLLWWLRRGEMRRGAAATLFPPEAAPASPL